jgi:hypothetical protein
MPPVKVPNETKAELRETTHCLPRFVRRSIAETCARTGPRKKGAGNLLPVIPVHDTMNCDSALQLAKTAMSPVEDSWKHR